MEPKPQKLTVLMVASSYPRFAGDTASVFLKNLARHLSNAGVQMHVIAPGDAQVRHDMDERDLKVHYFRYFPECPQMLAYGSGILANLRKHPWVMIQIPFFLVALLFSMIWQCRKIKPSIIHAHWIIPSGFISAIVGKIFGIPVIISAHGSDAYGLNRGIFAWLKKYSLEHSQAWTANTANTARAAYATCQDLRKTLTIIPMGVEVARFASGNAGSVRDYSMSDDFPIVLFVGRLVEQKGVRYLIEAVADLVTERKLKLRLWIVGDGDDRDDLEKLAISLGVHEAVEFKGLIPNDLLPDYYAAADVFVAPATFDRGDDTEGQGVVIIEAMAAGVPVIASKIGGIKDVIVDGENGTLVEPGNAPGLANAIQKCLADTEIKIIAERAYQTVKKEYDWRVIAQRFSGLYTKHGLCTEYGSDR